ncbi:unnamed protein product, partial [Schistosoma mattheei]
LTDSPITSTQNITDQSKVLEFRNSLSPIINQPQSSVIIDDSIISNSLIENYPVTTNSQQKLSSKFLTPKLRSKSILKEVNHNSNTTTTTTTNGDDDDHNNTKVKLKTTLSTGKRTPIHKQSRQSTHNSQSKSKSITEKKMNNNEEMKNLLASSSRKQNVNSSKDISIQQRKKSMSALCTQTLRPVIVRLPSNVDLDATKIVPCLEESESLNKQQDKSNQTLMVSNSVHKKSCGVTNELLPDNHYKAKLNNNEITPLSTTPKRLSVSQIKVSCHCVPDINPYTNDWNSSLMV